MYIQFEGYPIRLVRRSNSRRIALTSHKGTDVLTLTVPPWARSADIQAFLQENLEWIRRHAVRTDAWHPSYAPGEIHPCLGSYVILGQHGVPSGEAFAAWRMELFQDLVTALLPQWEQAMGVRVRALRFRNTRSQWGSCQVATHTVTLAHNLAKAPRECVEYVLVHELCHLLHPDHSPAFHAEMTRFLPDWKERKALLNAFDMNPRPGESMMN